MARKRSTASYLNAAKANRNFIPSLKKYSRRRSKLSPQEKSAITRAQNALKGRGNLVALTDKQFKKLDPALQLGKGIQALSLNIVEEGDRLTVDKDGQPVVRSRSGKRRWRFVSVEPELELLVDAAESEFDSGANQVSMWNTQGRAGETSRDLPAFIKMVVAFLNQYANITQWLLGIASLRQI